MQGTNWQRGASSLHTVFGRTFFSIDYQNDRKNDGPTAGMAGLKCENGNVTLIHVFHLVPLQHHARGCGVDTSSLEAPFF